MVSPSSPLIVGGFIDQSQSYKSIATQIPHDSELAQKNSGTSKILNVD
jgi:hypothetical protein